MVETIAVARALKESTGSIRSRNRERILEVRTGTRLAGQTTLFENTRRIYRMSAIGNIRECNKICLATHQQRMIYYTLLEHFLNSRRPEDPRFQV